MVVVWRFYSLKICRITEERDRFHHWICSISSWPSVYGDQVCAQCWGRLLPLRARRVARERQPALESSSEHTSALG